MMCFEHGGPTALHDFCCLVPRVFILARIELICCTIAPSLVNLHQTKCSEEEKKEEEEAEEEVLWCVCGVLQPRS